MKQIRHIYIAGFTLIELIVSMAIFTIVVFIATSAVLSMLDSNRKAQAMRTTMEGVGFALDDIGREARTGWNYHCRNDEDPSPQSASITFTACPSGDNGIEFITAEGAVDYYFDNTGKIKKSFTGLTPGDSYSSVLLTPSEANITNARFYVLGNQNYGLGSGADQPRILVTVDGQVQYLGKVQLNTDFTLETLVTSRYPSGNH